jgi:transcriptional regulator with XRE-family HTH domain
MEKDASELDGGAPFRVEAVEALANYRLRVTWGNGKTTEHDVKQFLGRDIFAPVRDEAVFKAVKVAEYGSGVEWPGAECDLGADGLWYEAHPERNPWPDASQIYGAEFKAWRKAKGWTQDETAQHLGISPRTVRAYEAQQLPVSRTVALAMKGIDSAELLNEEFLAALRGLAKALPKQTLIGALDTTAKRLIVTKDISKAATARRKKAAA